MTDYPEWLVDRVAYALYDEQQKHRGTGGQTIHPTSPIYFHLAKAALRALGFHQATTPQNWESTLQREETQ